MRHIIASILLLLPVSLAGCNPPANSAPAGAAPPKRLTQKEIDERHAANFLAAAKDYESEGQPVHAVTTLQELVEMYPDCEAAREAHELLAKLEAQADDGAVESDTPD